VIGCEFAVVASVDQIPDGGLLGVTGPDGKAIVLVRFGDRVHAFMDECTHQAFPLSAGEVSADGTIECVWHGARFDCATGAACRPPAVEPLTMYDVKVEGGRVLVRTTPRPTVA
jgi:3-phenylpropionate/trans-cinnamate dioxygenase ferredoxin subunit